MNIWEALGTTAGQAIAAPIDATGNAISKVITTDAQRLAFQDKLSQYQHDINLAQNDTNKVEAANSNVFVSGWRPALGWACAISVFLNFIIQAVASNYIWVKMCITSHTLLEYPSPHALIELTCGILGLYGTQRSVEKIMGKSS